MAGRQAALFLVVLSVAAGPVSQLARASDDSVDSVETARQHMELAIEADEEMHEAYDPLLEFVETFREIKKAVEEDAALSTDAIDRVSQFDLVSLLDVIREAAQAKFDLLGRLITDIASGIGEGAMALMGEEAAFIRPRRSKRGKKTTTTTSSSTTLPAP
ncbi:hypothetical protein TGRUB_202110 [Toxoplasma gondii RUB]|uniref:Transmembrane protein n=1 Tax=Toxoplasma gondii RUB TaxID=935652 RepID=A0A086LZG8_TOXGO|nr:hypothetical protein TGRUB_202110 [Toxoplasma gondii RUB]